jgi:hypothetical protein
MPDSKITNLSPSPYLLDRDLMVVVTGYLNEGSYPQTCQVPVSYIRRYITRLDLLLNPVSGIGNYYNSGLNILSIWGTGIHAVPGNNVEIQFSQNTPAGQKYGKTGPICHSGIISTTGLNAYSGHPWGNLIRVDTHSQWPYSGIISQTGLNIIRGNLIDIQFDPASPAATIMHSKDGSWDNNFNKNSNLGNPYHSGIVSVTGLNATKGNLIDINFSADWPHSGTISTTGLNIIDGNGIGYTIDSSWPYKYEIFNTEKTKYGSSVTINNTGTQNSSTSKFNILTLSYNDFYQSKTNQNLSLLATACFKVSDISFGDRPYVPGAGALNEQKIYELLPISGSIVNYTYQTCATEQCGVDENNQPIFCDVTVNNNSSVTIGYNELANFVQNDTFNYVINSFTLNIGISGNGNDQITNIHSYPITFRNSTQGGTTSPLYNTKNEIYRNNTEPYIVNGIDPITIRASVNLNINSSNFNTSNSIALCAFITNVRATRTYTNTADFIPNDPCVGDNTTNSYSYSTTRCYCPTSATIDAKFIKAENIVL